MKTAPGRPCPLCRLSQRTVPMRQARRAHEVKVAGWTFATTLGFDTCPKCRSDFDGGPDGAFDRRVALALLEAGEQDAAAVGFVRAAMGLRSVELADLLGVTRQTVARWESGKTRIDRANYLAFSLLIEERSAAKNPDHPAPTSRPIEARLRALATPTKPRKLRLAPE